MRNLLIPFSLILMFVLPLEALPQNISPFPLDMSRTWVYDDGTVEKITSFKKVQLSRTETINIFSFDSYNHQPRIFFTVGSKVFEWTFNNTRLWYDFAAEPGTSWKVNWNAMASDGSGMRDRKIHDMNEGAVVMLIANDEKVSTPAGDFENCYHFKISRDISDAAYVEEWFAPGIGCVMRVWDSIAGPRQQKLVSVKNPEFPNNMKIRMDVSLSRDVYRSGDDIDIEVSILNWSEGDITLQFPTSLQVDYIIDKEYRYSSSHAFTEAETEVTISSHDVFKWTFTHTADDFDIPPGTHEIIAELEGYELSAGDRFIVTASQNPLPEEISLSASMEKNTFSPGEPVKFSLTATNETANDITLNIVEKYPLTYSLGIIHRFPSPLKALPETIEVVVPGSSSITWDGVLDADGFFISSGEYTLSVGIWGYTGSAEVDFTVTRELSFGTITGTVAAYGDNRETTTPLTGVKISLWPVMPKNHESELLILPGDGNIHWSTISDDNGEFLLDNVTVGLFYTLSVEKAGFSPFQKTFRMLSDESDIRVVLKPREVHPDKPLNFKRRLVSGLVVTFGTGKSAYTPDSDFKAFLFVTNRNEEAVKFTFASERFAGWSIRKPDGTFIWSSENDDALINAEELEMIIPPEETVEFVHKATFKDKVPKTGKKYEIHGNLLFTSSSLADLKPGDVGGFVKVLIIPAQDDRVTVKTQRIEAQGHLRDLFVDLRDSLKTVIDMSMNKDNLSGVVNISEIRENLHEIWQNHRFVKMIEIGE